jgi:hypothetical protein
MRWLAIVLVGCSLHGSHGHGPPGDSGAPGDNPNDHGDASGDAPASVWHPQPGTSWQWQLSGTIDPSLDVKMYDIDLFDAPQTVIDGLHARGVHVICYFSAGSREDWRPDANLFPANAIGNHLDGWPNEEWIDTRSPVVRQIMQARLDRAASKSCDGVEPDNVDGYKNNNGLGLTAATQLDYNAFLASEGHARNLSVGLKNDTDQIPQLVDHFDWVLDEQCFQYSECDTLAPFVNANKAAFEVEYGTQTLASSVCPQANAANLDTLIKDMNLDAFRVSCR